MVETGAAFMAGLFAWTFLEYLIHAWLGHTFQTFATPLHAVHHRDPDAVFTIGAWIPLAVIWIVSVGVFGWTTGVAFFTGIVSGFVLYEAVHYRIHFRCAESGLEGYLRSRHLVHHRVCSGNSFGVTSALWDLVFGTEPLDQQVIQQRQSMASTLPARGRTNLNKITYFILPHWYQRK
jgi:dihydroceramide fatty acyl 2-hydroxylase